MAARRQSLRLGQAVKHEDENIDGITAAKRVTRPGKDTTTTVKAEANPRKRILNDRTNSSKATASSSTTAPQAGGSKASAGDVKAKPVLTRKASTLSRASAGVFNKPGTGKEDNVDAMAIDEKRPIKGNRKTAAASAKVDTTTAIGGGAVAGSSKAVFGFGASKLATSGSTATNATRKGLAVKKGANNGSTATAIPRPTTTTAGTKPTGAKAGAKRGPAAAAKKHQLAVKADPDDEEEDEPANQERDAKRLRTSEPDHAAADVFDDDAVPVDEETAYEEAVRKAQATYEPKGKGLKEGEEGWEDLDAGDEDDPLMVTEYVTEVYDYMRQLEMTTLPDGDYMARQTELTWKMRGILVDWLVEVHVKFRMLPETIFLASNLVDRFLSTRAVSLLKLQLVGVASLFVAAKYEEVVCPSIVNFAKMTAGACDVEGLLKAERYLLKMLEFNLSYPNPLNFLRRISKADGYDIQSRTFAKYFLEISVVDHRLIATPPSLLAAAATWFARKVLDRGPWDANLVHYSGYSQREILPTAQIMLDYVLRSGSVDAPEHANFHKKYSSKRYYRASEITRDWALEKYSEDSGLGRELFCFEEFSD